MSDDKILLLPDQKSQKPWYKRTRCICPLLVTIGKIFNINAIVNFGYFNFTNPEGELYLNAMKNTDLYVYE